MKKRILVGLLSLAALAWNTPQSYALFGLFGGCCGCGHGCSKYSTYLCIRPYNAFSPVCCGSLCATGCCPMPFGCGPCCGPCMPNCSPSCFNDCCNPCDSCCSSGCSDGSCLPAPGPAAPAPTQRQVPSAMPSGPSVPGFTPPSPNPLPTSQRGPAVMPYNYNGVQTAAYHPAYYGGYQPQYYGGYPQAPYYGYQPAYNPGYYPGYYPVPYPMAPSYQAPNYWYGGRN